MSPYLPMCSNFSEPVPKSVGVTSPGSAVQRVIAREYNARRSENKTEENALDELLSFFFDLDEKATLFMLCMILRPKSFLAREKRNPNR